MAIAAVEITAPESIALTPKGSAIRTVYRLRRELAALDPADRAEVLDLTAVELDIVHCPNGCHLGS